MSVLSTDEQRARSEQLVGQTINDRYRIDAIIGIGSMGTVFRTHHLGLKRDVALKVLHRQFTADHDMANRFAREAESASRLEHPNCVTVTDFGATAQGDHYMVMPLIQGTELYELLDGPVALPRVFDFAIQILKGLSHAHSRGVVHRDVKPENIFVTKDHEGRELIKVLDFGIAKIVTGEASKEAMTRAGMVFGTPAYMSPEQATGGQVDARTDLYAVGVLMYAMLTGHLPFDDDDPVQLVRKQIREPPPPLPAPVPVELRAIVERLLAKDPADRYESADAVLERLRAVAGLDLAARGRTEFVPAPGKLAIKRRWLPLAAAAGGIVLIATLAATLGGGDGGAVAVAERSDAAPTWGALWDRLRKPPVDAAGADAGLAEGAQADANNAEGTMAERALQANLASIDALIESRNYDAARISIGPLLEVYPGEAELHWRMGKVAFAAREEGGNALALDNYAAAIDADPDLLHDLEFRVELDALLAKPEIRNKAVDLAIETLEDEGHDVLLGWLNVDSNPLPFEQRRRVIAHLEQTPAARSRINAPLQAALDLWQASAAPEPCASLKATLETIEVDPDSYLLGTLRSVSVPTPDEDAGPDAEPTEVCDAANKALERVRLQHESMYQGIDPIVPRAYRKRPKTPSRSKRRRR